jgi:hypothetical protein
MDEYQFNSIAKINKWIVSYHIEEIKKTCNSIKNGHVLCIENKIVKDWMNAFLNWYWIYKYSKLI